ncbi:hypothetical protein RMATCC62417_16187 [Rhizopus microsporus]|nr:hypothetical protein RMATCC62417_16187 [Rhizopus microsporus]
MSLPTSSQQATFEELSVCSSPSSNSSFFMDKAESSSSQNTGFPPETPTIQSPFSGGSCQTSKPGTNVRARKQPSSGSLDRSMSQSVQRPTSPITSPSIHKSLNALDAKSIARDVERSTMHLRGEDIAPSSEQ